MQLHRWLASLAPCIILLFLLSLEVVDVEGRRSRKKHKARKHGRKHGVVFDGPPVHHGEGAVPDVVTQILRGRQDTADAQTAVPNVRTCENLPAYGDIRKNLSYLREKLHYLSNPIHIHVHGGHAWDDDVHSFYHMGHYCSDGTCGRRHHHPYTAIKAHKHTPGSKTKGHTPGPGAKKEHTPHTAHVKGEKGHHKPLSPGKAKQTPGKGSKQKKYTYKEHSKEHPAHETHIHVHITLDTEKDKFEKFMSKHYDDYVYARCDLMPPESEKSSPVTGTVLMRQLYKEPLEVKVNISGMAGFRPAGMAADHECHHGLHVHQFADLSQGCMSFGGHYNPKNKTHGPENDEDSHVGDWGNIDCDNDGNCVADMNITNSDLMGPFNIIGRGIVLHQLQDDLGKVGDKGSLATGNAGKRIACCGIIRTGPPDDEW